MLATELNPANYACFSQVEVSYLAAYKKSCDVCQKDLADTKVSLRKCIGGGPAAVKWYSDPTFIIGGFAVSLGVGLVVGVLLTK